MAEEWHLRYVGKEAKEIAASGLSLEEYYGFEGGDYVDQSQNTLQECLKFDKIFSN